MTSEKPAPFQRLGFVKLLLISFALWTGSFIIEQTIRWSDALQGFVCGLFHIFFLGFSWAVLILPWSLVIGGLYKAFEWQRFRSHWILTPSMAALAFTLIGFIQSPPTARGSFRRFAGTEMPPEATNIEYQLKGGGITDYSITYYFECSPASVSKLVEAMQMSRDHGALDDDLPLPGCPDHRQWTGGPRYFHSGDGWTFKLITDPTKTKVYVWMWCT